MRGSGRIKGESGGIRQVRSSVRIYARSEATLLLVGETGAGKEVVAQAVHEESPRGRGPFVAIDCAALPDALFESEVFGHERGAFTGALTGRRGLVGAAERGTLFLDEIENLPLAQQGKILRLLQNREYRPVGSERVHRADIRILAATNRSLDSMAECGRFRSDLLYRLDVLRIEVPPLRDRVEDISCLLAELAPTEGTEGGFPFSLPEDYQMRRLRERRWPGNVRELANVVERAVAIAPAVGWSSAWHAAIFGQRPEVGGGVVETSADTAAQCEWRESEVSRTRAALEKNRWRREATARDLGISRVTLWRRMRRLGLEA